MQAIEIPVLGPVESLRGEVVCFPLHGQRRILPPCARRPSGIIEFTWKVRRKRAHVTGCEIMFQGRSKPFYIQPTAHLYRGDTLTLIARLVEL